MIYCFFARGFEEIEAIATVDILRRANLDVTTVGIKNTEIEGSHEIPIITDIKHKKLNRADDIEAVILPGGMPGTTSLEKSKTLKAVIEYCVEKDLTIGAICAAPSILGHMNILQGKKATCFPGFENELYGANYVDAPIVIDGNIITAKGAGCVFDFAFALVEKLASKEIADKVKASMQFPY